MKSTTYHLYILECADGTYYTGICTDLDRRINEHNSDDQKGAKYTKSRRPVALAYSVSDIPNRSLATKGEIFVKALPKMKKRALIRGDERARKMLLEKVTG